MRLPLRSLIPSDLKEEEEDEHRGRGERVLQLGYNSDAFDASGDPPFARVAKAVLGRALKDLQEVTERRPNPQKRLTNKSRKIILWVHANSDKFGGYLFWLQMAYPNQDKMQQRHEQTMHFIQQNFPNYLKVLDTHELVE